MRGAIEIVILVRIHRPQKRPKPQQAKAQGNGNEINDDFQWDYSQLRRRAFKVTMSEDADIAIAAISGVT